MKAATLVLVTACCLGAQPLYFPSAETWERIDPASAGWDPAKLEDALDFAGERRSSGVVVLLRGKILAERHWPLPNVRKTADGRSIEDVASVQKSVTSTLAGVALSKGLVALEDPVSRHLGAEWSKAAPQQEERITLRHLLTMTSGLSDDLAFEADAGTKWRYNNAAYQKTIHVLAAAAGLTPNELTSRWLTSRIGMADTKWSERPSPPGTLGLYSTARDLARFGLLILAGGRWSGQAVGDNPEYLRAMLTSSQKLNPAYGYLWWLNGRPVVRATGSADALIPSAPKDLVAALGALDRRVYVVPSLELVVTRIGGPAQARGKRDFDDELWKRLSAAAGSRR